MDGHADTALLVLHGLRLSGFAGSDALAARWALEEHLVLRTLESARDEGWVVHRQGRVSGWMLSARGRAELSGRLEAELDAAGARGVAEDAYGAFTELNPDFLALCTDWQLRDVGGEMVINEHDDPAYDRTVIERLGAIHDRVSAVVAPIGVAVARFGGYRPRFDHAIGRVRANDVDWLTKPVIDSYHTVWFELHEDLLATLGLSREAETADRT